MRTLCQKVVPDGKVVGILCFDFSPLTKNIPDMFAGAAELFDLQLVYIDEDRSKDADSSWKECENCRENLKGLTRSEVKDLVDEWKGLSKDDAAGGTSALRLLKQGDYFGAIVQSWPARASIGLPASSSTVAVKAKSQNQHAVVFGKIKRSHTRDNVSVAMMMVFATIASGLIIAGVRKKAKRLDVALIRSLQVGVVELDIRDTIVGANDRAQEIFGVELPAFDLPDRRSERPFRSLIHPVIVRLDDAGQLSPGPVTFSRYESLMLERAVGHSSSYYAITTLSKQVIRISGSTFVNRNIEVHTFGTIETFVEPVHKDMVLAAFDALVDATQLLGKEGI